LQLRLAGGGVRTAATEVRERDEAFRDASGPCARASNRDACASDASTSVSPDPNTDVIAGKYRLECCLGEGGMGRVFYATHLDLCAPVAVKIVRDELAAHRDVVERMIREARTTACFRSEHVTRILDAGTLSSGAPFIVMEYLEGHDLRAELDEGGPLGIESAVSYVLQACEAVAEAHASGIVHRDIKPENLFLTLRTDGAPIIKILDFGISKHLGTADDISLTSPRTVLGSPAYMAPEQMRAQAEVDRRADIWSLGAVLYELLVGEPAFCAETLAEMCVHVLKDEPAPPRMLRADIPEELEAVIVRCLRKDRARRFDSVVDLAHALAPFGPPGSNADARRVERVASSRGYSPPRPVTPVPVPVRRSNVLESAPTSRPPPPAPRPFRWRLSLYVALVVAAGGGLSMHARRDRAPAVVAASSVASLVLATTDRAMQRSAHVGRVPAPPVSSPLSPPAPPSGVARSAAGPPRAATAAQTAASETVPVPSVATPKLDPWDPRVFGGRR